MMGSIDRRARLRVEVPGGRIDERRYVLDLLLTEWLGLDYDLTIRDERRTVIRLASSPTPADRPTLYPGRCRYPARCTRDPLSGSLSVSRGIEQLMVGPPPARPRRVPTWGERAGGRSDGSPEVELKVTFVERAPPAWIEGHPPGAGVVLGGIVGEVGSGRIAVLHALADYEDRV